ncbi:hypothetical protein ACRARE_11140 [Pseudooceanicola sp. 200-1SW]
MNELPGAQPRFLRGLDRMTRQDVLDAMALVDHYGDDWLHEVTGRRRTATRYIQQQNRRYPAKAIGYLAAQLCAGIARMESTPAKVERVERALVRCGFRPQRSRAPAGPGAAPSAPGRER